MTDPYFELPFFTNLLILLVVAKIFGEIFERFGQPAMIGEIFAGIILGPCIFNLIHRTEDNPSHFRIRNLFVGHPSGIRDKY